MTDGCRFGRSLYRASAAALGVLLALTTLLLGSAAADGACDLLIVVSTTSDWTVVALEGAGVYVNSYEIRQGEAYPDSRILTSPHLHITNRSLSQTLMTVVFDVTATGVTHDALGLRIEKGYLGTTFVQLFRVVGDDQELIGEYEHDGVADPNDPTNARRFTLPAENLTCLAQIEKRLAVAGLDDCWYYASTATEQQEIRVNGTVTIENQGVVAVPDPKVLVEVRCACGSAYYFFLSSEKTGPLTGGIPCRWPLMNTLVFPPGAIPTPNYRST